MNGKRLLVLLSLPFVFSGCRDLVGPVGAQDHPASAVVGGLSVSGPSLRIYSERERQELFRSWSGKRTHVELTPEEELRLKLDQRPML